LFLFVRRVTILSQDTFDHRTKLGLHAFFNSPVDAGVFVALISSIKAATVRRW
jgi:hypothetical protein